MADTPWFVDHSFTAASSDIDNGTTSAKEITNWLFDKGDPSGATALGIQALRTFVEINDAAGTATLQFVISEDDAGTTKTVYREVGTCTVTARQTGSDGASGNYIMDVSWAVSGRDTIDCMGAVKPCRVWLLCTALSAGETVRVRATYTRNAG